MRLRAGAVLATAVTFSLAAASLASAASPTPGWECVPTTAGQAVTSGGTGSAPSCSSGTAVLAPTYVSSGGGCQPPGQTSGGQPYILHGPGDTSPLHRPPEPAVW